MSHETENLQKFDRTDTWLMLGVGFVTLLYPLFFFDRWIGLLDEGYIHAIAADINRGDSLYGDIYVDNPFPGAFQILAFWFRLFETSVLSSRYLALLGFAIYVAAFFRILRAVVSRPWALLFVVFLLAYRIWAFPHWQVYSYSLASAALITLAAALAMHFWENGSRIGLFVAGLVAGGAILCKQDYGLGVTGGLGLAMLLVPWLRREGLNPWYSFLVRPAIFGIGALVVVVAGLISLWMDGVLLEFYTQAVLQPLRGATSFNPYPRLPDLWPLWRQDAEFRAQIGHYFPAILVTLFWGPISVGWALRETALWEISLKLVFWTPIVSFLAALTLWIVGSMRQASVRRPALAPARFLLLGLAGGFLLAFPPPRDWTHLMMILPPQMALLTVLLTDAQSRFPRRVRRFFWWTSLSMVGIFMVSSAFLALELRSQMTVVIDSPRAGVYADSQNGPILNEVLSWVDEGEASEFLPVYPLQPMIPFLADRRVAGGFHVIWPVQGEGRDERILADLEEHQVPRIVYSLSQYAHLGSFQENAPALYEYLVTNFEIDRVFADEPMGPLLLGLRRERLRAGVRLQDLEARLAGGAWESWPFAEVLVPEVGAPGHEVPATFALRLPAEARTLAFSYGVDPDDWMNAPSGPYAFSVQIRDPKGTLLQGRTWPPLNPRMSVSSRRWFPGELDLTGLAGREVVVEFIVTAELSSDRSQRLAGFHSLRVTSAVDDRVRVRQD
jgi:hypothetical protein